MLSVMLQRHNSTPERSCSARYTRLIQRVRWGVLLVWLASLPVCIVYGVSFVGQVTLEWEPPENSRAHSDRARFQEYFPDQVGATDFALLLEWDDRTVSDPIYPDQGNVSLFQLDSSANGVQSYDNYTTIGMQSFSVSLRAAVYSQWCATSKTELDAGLATLTLPSCSRGQEREDGSTTGFDLVTAMNGYWYTRSFSERGADALLSRDRSRSLIQITFQTDKRNSTYPDRSTDFNDFLHSVIYDAPDCNGADPPLCTKGLSELFLRPAGMHVTIFSLAGGIDEIVDVLATDLLIIDGIAVPIGLILLALALRNARLVLPAIAVLLVTAFGSFAIMRGVAESMTINALVVPLMMSFSVGLCIHSQLFLLNRFREALLEEEPAFYAVQRMLRTAGHTVLVSQISLMACCVPFCFLEIESACALAISLIVVSGMTLLSSLTLSPALLLAFPSFFEQARVRTRGFALGTGRPQTAAALAGMLRSQRTGGGSIPDGEEEEAGADMPWCGCCAGLSHLVRDWRVALVVSVLIITAVVPLGVVLFRDIELADGVDFYLPRRADLTHTAERIYEGFGRGTIISFKVGIVPRQGWPNMQPDQSYFDGGHELVETAVDRTFNPDTGLSDIRVQDVQGSFYFQDLAFNSFGVVDIGNCLVSYLAGASDTEQNPQYCVLQIATTLTFGNASFDVSNPITGYVINTMYALHRPWVEAMSPRGRDMVTAWRESMDIINADDSVPYYAVMHSTAANSHDAVDTLYDAWHWVGASLVGIVAAVAFLFTGSVATTIVGVLCAACTTLFACGCAVLVYQHDALGWTGVDNLKQYEQGEGNGDCIFWGVPVACVPVLVGLSLGYHLFQGAGALEFYHRTNAEVEDAIHLGVQSTSGAVCCSLAAMCAAFSGHLFSQMPLLGQVALPLLAGLLFEALFARPFLAPAAMQLLGPLNFWPMRERRPGAFQYCSIRTSATALHADLEGSVPGAARGGSGELMKTKKGADVTELLP
eukprot:TRINITY_DN9504_c0_g1_i1.p1 TRINITY_DN9504_c0_g1~~TRINITY_DN9504_c0_g1_i1.p1  ORF type:complete len:1027 (+),score=321.83 TRINITY_DN9504_c0_g1_i1:108-3083(+)